MDDTFPLLIEVGIDVRKGKELLDKLLPFCIDPGILVISF
jgi:hypothetical protein